MTMKIRIKIRIKIKIRNRKPPLKKSLFDSRLFQAYGYV